jgi:hypothetical protein
VIFFAPLKSPAVNTIAPVGALIFDNFPAATGLRTKRTQYVAGASAVK